MEQLNFIHIIGRIGNIRNNAKGTEANVRNFSVVTSYLYRNQENSATEETTWMDCVLWAGKRCPDLSLVKVGAGVDITGRLRNRRFTGTDGVDRYVVEVQVGEIKFLPEGEALQAQNGIMH